MPEYKLKPSAWGAAGLQNRRAEFDFPAIKAHGEQKGKYTDEPYWHHLHKVAAHVERFDRDDRTTVAAWFHDTVLDTSTTYGEFVREFGDQVGMLVRELTDQAPSSMGNRAAMGGATQLRKEGGEG
jgi:(p)ppGpp synthase/HD superfamily hydrolase